MELAAYWQYNQKDILTQLNSSADTGLNSDEAQHRLSLYATKKKEKPQLVKDILLFLAQFKSPLTLLLVAAVILSAFLGETSDVFIILFILIATGIMSFIQERHAGLAVEKLRSLIRSKVKVLRDGKELAVKTVPLVDDRQEHSVEMKVWSDPAVLGQGPGNFVNSLQSPATDLQWLGARTTSLR